MTTLAEFNGLPAQAAQALLAECCASPMWARDVAARRPCASLADLLAAAAAAWSATSEAERLKALDAHPMIGAKDALGAGAAAVTRAEQGQVAAASTATRQELAELNAAYLARHGFKFIVCAAGKPADGMLQALRERIGRDTAREFKTACAEQAAITALRLARRFGAPHG